ncbi:MAG: hypothetical protein U5R48_11175 [Gammaproteobacteria bacterium]|nr:hypothetical protein [Gammaproteobacteria bacterium]
MSRQLNSQIAFLRLYADLAGVFGFLCITIATGNGRRSDLFILFPEFEAFEVAGCPPFFDVLEEAFAAARVPLRLSKSLAPALTFVVPERRGAIGRGHHRSLAGQNEIDPGRFGLLGRLDFCEAFGFGMADDLRNGSGVVHDVVRDV